MGVLTASSCSDDDPTATNFQISMSASSTSLQENGGMISLTVALDEVNDREAIPFQLDFDGNATLNEDYGRPGENMIASGSQATTIIITGIDDEIVEEDETIVVRLMENLENVTIQNGTVNLTISDDDEVSDPGKTNFHLSVTASNTTFSEKWRGCEFNHCASWRKRWKCHTI